MRPRKRARTDTTVDDNGAGEADPLHSTDNLAEIISLLTPAQQNKFLTDAATKHPEVMATLNKWNNARLAKISKQREKELTTEVTFHHMIDKVVDLVDKAAAKDVSKSRAYDVAGTLMKKIEDNYLKVIVTTTRPESLFETKRNAIEMVREIFEICLLNSLNTMVGRVMRQNFWDYGPFLKQVLGMFSKEEMLRLIDPGCQTHVWNHKKEAFETIPWIEAFERTVKHTEDYGVGYDNALCTTRALAILNAARGTGPEVGPDQKWLPY